MNIYITAVALIYCRDKWTDKVEVKASMDASGYGCYGPIVEDLRGWRIRLTNGAHLVNGLVPHPTLNGVNIEMALVNRHRSTKRQPINYDPVTYECP